MCMCVSLPLLQLAVNNVLGDTEQILNALFIPIIIKVSLNVNNGNSRRSRTHPCDGAPRPCKCKCAELSAVAQSFSCKNTCIKQ